MNYSHLITFYFSWFDLENSNHWERNYPGDKLFLLQIVLFSSFCKNLGYIGQQAKRSDSFGQYWTIWLCVFVSFESCPRVHCSTLKYLLLCPVLCFTGQSPLVSMVSVPLRGQSMWINIYEHSDVVVRTIFYLEFS